MRVGDEPAGSGATVDTDAQEVDAGDGVAAASHLGVEGADEPKRLEAAEVSRADAPERRASDRIRHLISEGSVSSPLLGGLGSGSPRARATAAASTPTPTTRGPIATARTTPPNVSTPSDNPSAADYAPRIDAHRRALRKTAEAGASVERGDASAVGAVTGAILCLPGDLVVAPLFALAAVGHAALTGALDLKKHSGVLGILGYILVPFAALLAALAHVLEILGRLIDLPFRGLRAVINAVADVFAERPATDGAFRRVAPESWPLLEANRATAARAEHYRKHGPRAPYDAIVVPGYAHSSFAGPLHPDAQDRLDEAIADFRAGKAPFIIVSGGNVHPVGTPYNEAFEMAGYLRAQGVPGDAILIEPHAEHTTTNLRNVGRLMQSLGLERALVTTTPTPVTGQSAYLGRPGALWGLDVRTSLELGYRLGQLTNVDPWHTLYVPSDDVNLVGLDDGAIPARDP